ncbi:hypothetical protein BD414DRAFT_540899 [Trametes punicea]|nr:hypothetical protein BD414DRAFT_540899 [Trametes punicea]
MTAASILKALLLVVSGGFFTWAIAPPKRAAGASIYKGQLFEYLVRYLAWLGCILVTASSTIHALLLTLDTSHAAVNPAVQYLCPTSAKSPRVLDALPLVTPRFLIGAVLLLAGAAIRLLSFHALGDLFTYEVVVKSAHRLVTSGPYTLVRHPSYTGVIALVLGTQLVHFGPGAFVSECGIERTPFALFIWIWRIGSAFSVVSLCRRCSVEDAQLRERFGAEWDAYRERVQYCLLPYVF